MLDLELDKPQRQSVVGIAVIFFQNLKKAVNIIFSIIVVQFGMKTDYLFLWVLIGITLLIVLTLSILIYQKFFFYIEEDQFVIEKGLFSRDKISVPFERIQSVHINQNVVQRVLNVVGLKIDTAGSVNKELEIAALPKAYARSIQEFLIEKRDAEELGQQHKSKEELVEGEEQVARGSEIPLISLSLFQVVKIGLTENHLKTSLAFFALINGYIWQNQEVTIESLQSYIVEGNEWLNNGVIAIPLVFVAFLLFSILVSVVQSILRYYGLRFFIDPKGVQSVSGLLKRAEYQIPINKIQFLKWSSNPLRKLAGLKTLVVKQASSKATNDKQSLMVPGCSDEQLEQVIQEFYPELRSIPLTNFRADSFLKVQMVILFAIIPAIIIGALGQLDPSLFIGAIIWLSVATPLSIQYAVKMSLNLNSEVLQLCKGWLFPKVEVLKYYKLQNVAIRQNIFQKRRNLVHLDFYTAAGKLRMWQLDEEVAQRLYNYILFKIEKSDRNWM